GVTGWPHNHKNVGPKKRERHEQTTLHDKPSLVSLVFPTNATEWKRPRCGVPDYPTLLRVDLSYYSMNKKKKEGLSRQQRKKRFALFGGRWEKTDLTYRILRFPWQMSEAKVRHVLDQAFRVWGEATPLTFTEIMSEKADIVIDFNRYWHGDSLPFDGPGESLPMPFSPKHTEKENFKEKHSIVSVAAHEFGHILGLQHSLEPDAIMCPFYSDSYPLQLSEDDKNGIQYLYGPQGIQHLTLTNFDAVSRIRGELFFFKSQYVWRIRDGRLEAGYPALASRHWRGLPDYLDAVYEDRSGNIWFFQGDNYWVFDAERRITGPDSVWRLGLPVSDIQAALKWEVDNALKVFLFKSSSYWSFSPLENRVDNIHPQTMPEWSGIPKHIDAAFQDRYGYANFLSGMQYWKFDPVELKVLDGYPRNIGRDFFGC
uniref:Matrix metallopeptidase 11b n=1 Tax=Neogobius melanostomus TaxID=47308 RepID=A0A8C6TTM4_9GOBI